MSAVMPAAAASRRMPFSGSGREAYLSLSLSIATFLLYSALQIHFGSNESLTFRVYIPCATSADNIRQTGALADNVEEVLGRSGILPKQIEGRSTGNWILMDYGDVIINVFDEENRLFYDLERIWRDGKAVSIEDIEEGK